MLPPAQRHPRYLESGATTNQFVRAPDISQNLSNNVSVRTVKFHVSTLLEKFEVRGRVDLMLEAAEFLPIEGVHKRASAKAAASASASGTPGVAAGALLPLAPAAARLGIAESLDRRAGD